MVEADDEQLRHGDGRRHRVFGVIRWGVAGERTGARHGPCDGGRDTLRHRIGVVEARLTAGHPQGERCAGGQDATPVHLTRRALQLMERRGPEVREPHEDATDRPKPKLCIGEASGIGGERHASGFHGRGHDAERGELAGRERGEPRRGDREALEGHAGRRAFQTRQPRSTPRAAAPISGSSMSFFTDIHQCTMPRIAAT